MTPIDHRPRPDSEATVLTGAVLQPLASCGVSPFQLTQWYCAIKLEERLKGTGMKAFRKSVRVFACKHLGLKSSTPHAAVRERIRTVLREGGFPLREDREAEPKQLPGE